MFSKSSPFSLVALRYVTVSSATIAQTSIGKKSVTSTPLKIPIQLKLTYRMAAMRSSLNEVHHGLDEFQAPETVGQESYNTIHHYTANQMELYWSEEEEEEDRLQERQDSDSESGDDQMEKEVLIHRTPGTSTDASRVIQPRTLSTQSDGTYTSPKPKFAKAKGVEPKGDATVSDLLSTTESLTVVLPEGPLLTEEAVSERAMSARPYLQIQLSSVSLTDEPTECAKKEPQRRPPPKPPPPSAVMKGIKKNGKQVIASITLPDTRPPPPPLAGEQSSPHMAPAGVEKKKKSSATSRGTFEGKGGREKKPVNCISLTIEPNSPDRR
jgi:hypothetical protein